VNSATLQIQALRDRHERRQLRILALCLLGSLLAHLLGYAWVASRKVAPVARKVPEGFMMVEQWPSSQPPAAGGELGKAIGETGAARAGPQAPVSREAPTPTPEDVAGAVQKKGILRALGSLGRGATAKGLPGALASGDLPTGLPDGTRAQVEGGGLPARRGGGGGAPAALGDLGLGGGGAGGGGGGSGLTGRPGGSSVGVGSGQVGSAEVDQVKLDAYVRARLGGLRACYETQLKVDPRSDGTMRLRFSIRPTGEIADVEASENSLGSEAMADCLVRILRTWKTPFRPSEGVSVEYPFVFRPSKD